METVKKSTTDAVFLHSVLNLCWVYKLSTNVFRFLACFPKLLHIGPALPKDRLWTFAHCQSGFLRAIFTVESAVSRRWSELGAKSEVSKRTSSFLNAPVDCCSKWCQLLFASFSSLVPSVISSVQSNNVTYPYRPPLIGNSHKPTVTWKCIQGQLTTCTNNKNNNTCLTAICPGLPRWAGTRKVKPIWILLKQETVSGSGISWAICKSNLAPDR